MLCVGQDLCHHSATWGGWRPTHYGRARHGSEGTRAPRYQASHSPLTALRARSARTGELVSFASTTIRQCSGLPSRRNPCPCATSSAPTRSARAHGALAGTTAPPSRLSRTLRGSRWRVDCTRPGGTHRTTSVQFSLIRVAPLRQGLQTQPDLDLGVAGRALQRGWCSWSNRRAA